MLPPEMSPWRAVESSAFVVPAPFGVFEEVLFATFVAAGGVADAATTVVTALVTGVASLAFAIGALPVEFVCVTDDAGPAVVAGVRALSTDFVADAEC